MKEFTIVKRGVLENMGLYRGHIYIVMFYPEMGHRCGYVLLNHEDNEKIDEYESIVNANGGVTYVAESAEDFFKDCDLVNHRVIGWDYHHSWDVIDFETMDEYYKEHPNPVLEEVVKLMMKAHEDNSSFKRVATLDVATNDCKSVIDDLVYYHDTGNYRWNNDDDDEQ